MYRINSIPHAIRRLAGLAMIALMRMQRGHGGKNGRTWLRKPPTSVLRPLLSFAYEEPITTPPFSGTPIVI